jgi:hypothetical protein
VTNRLVLLLGDFENSDKDIALLLNEWSSAGILGSVAWSNASLVNNDRPMTTFSEDAVVEQRQLFELLSSRILA